MDSWTLLVAPGEFWERRTGGRQHSEKPFMVNPAGGQSSRAKARVPAKASCAWGGGATYHAKRRQRTLKPCGGALGILMRRLCCSLTGPSPFFQHTSSTFVSAGLQVIFTQSLSNDTCMKSSCRVNLIRHKPDGGIHQFFVTKNQINVV